jgi:hypothetical protein
VAGNAVARCTETAYTAGSATFGTIHGTAVTFSAGLPVCLKQCRMFSANRCHRPAGGVFAGCIKIYRIIIPFGTTPDTYQHDQNQAAFEFRHSSLLLSVAGDTAFVVGAAVTAVAAGRVQFSLDLVHGHEIATVRHVTVGTVSVFDRGFHFNLIGMAVVAEGAFVTGGAEAVIRGCVETMVLDKGWSMTEGIKRLHGAFLLIFMTFGATDLLADCQCLGM